MYPFLNEHNIHMAIGKSVVSIKSFASLTPKFTTLKIIFRTHAWCYTSYKYHQFLLP